MAARDLIGELAAVLRERKAELGLSEDEILFITSMMAGFAYSPASVRTATIPAFKAAAKVAIDLMDARKKGKPDSGGLSN
jgi:hypothetical protein